jgi:predicted S18 family serine protease
VSKQRTTVGAHGVSAVTVTVGQTYCNMHGWIQTDGIIGPIGFIVEHEDCATT